jgi:hypothetical protein
MMRTIIGILVIAAVATLGDSVWFEFGVRDRIAFGVIHGAVLLMTVGGVLGERARRFVPGLLVGAASGIGGALVYYLLGSIGRTSAMLVAWASVWILLAAFDGFVLRRGGRVLEVLTRGLSAALLSGIAFYVVVGVLWGHESAAGRNYWHQFWAWVVAWAPGMLALTMPFSNRSTEVPVNKRG